MTKDEIKLQIRKILDDSYSDDWAENLSDPSADEHHVQIFSKEYAVEKLAELFLSLKADI